MNISTVSLYLGRRRKFYGPQFIIFCLQTLLIVHADTLGAYRQFNLIPSKSDIIKQIWSLTPSFTCSCTHNGRSPRAPFLMRFVILNTILRIIENQFSPRKAEIWYFTVDFTFKKKCCINVTQIPATGEKDERENPIERNRKFCLLFYQLHISDFECLYLLASAYCVQR